GRRGRAMNSLFLGLLAAGIALVIGVIVYNWLQERRARRRVETAFETPGRGRERAEPGLRGGDHSDAVAQSVAIEQSPEEFVDMSAEGDVPEVPLPRPLSPASLPRDSIAPDPDIESVVILRPAVAAGSEGLTPGGAAEGAPLSRAAALHYAKPLRWLGRRAANLPWQPIGAAPGPWQEIA